MAQPIMMPKLGQSEEEGTVVKWHKREGDKVRKGDVLFEVETEKAVLEVESFVDGTLLKILVAEGQTVPVTATVAFVGEPGEPIPHVEPPAPAATPSRQAEPKPAAAAAPARTQAVTPAAAPLPASSPAPQAAPARLLISPRARALARQAAIHPENIRGTGPGGRIVERDVQAHLSAHGYDRIRISPAARKLAIQENIDILTVRASGDAGRIMVRDIERAMTERPRPLSRMRQVIAQRLTQSVLTAPHFYVTVEVDVTELLALRKDLRKQGVQYSVTDFILMATVRSLVDFPVVNSTTDGKTVHWHSAVHIGMATSVEDGLVVPVIRDADTLTLKEIHQFVADLAIKARNGSLRPDEMSGSTFTVSNMGMLNVENFTAIINPGESAILAVSSTIEKPVVRKSQIEVRAMMKLTLSSDHRLIDGALAARFINAIKKNIENTELWRSLT